ncbi:MAG: arginine repressor [Lachnospiraceae bacterium]|nr:arginine repressor [Lachnospiraceae bacterium]MBR6637416.1 arginine repressor [Lachnospiraceae bacterium]
MKTARHEKIIELINKYQIETQEELADRLNAEGFAVTQATVSRDIRALKLTKMPVDGGRQKYAIIQNDTNELNEKYLRVLKDAFISIDRAENIAVVKTVSGMAMAFAAALDAMKWHEVVGCVAGDDTVMCAIRTKDDALVIVDRIKKIATSVR